MTIKRGMSYMFLYILILLGCIIRIYSVAKPGEVVMLENIVFGLLAFAGILRCLLVRNYIVLMDDVLKINEIVSSKEIEINSIQSVSIKKYLLYPSAAIVIITNNEKKHRIRGSVGEREFELLYEKLAMLVSDPKTSKTKIEK